MPTEQVDLNVSATWTLPTFGRYHSIIVFPAMIFDGHSLRYPDTTHVAYLPVEARLGPSLTCSILL